MYVRLARMRRYAGVLTTPQGVRSRQATVDTLYFDSDDWAVRFVALAVGRDHESSEMPLLTPMQVRRANYETERLEFELTAEPYQLPAADRFKPLSSQTTEYVTRYYGLPAFWSGSRVWGDQGTPAQLAARGRVAVASSGGASGGMAGRSSRSTATLEAEEARPPELHPHSLLMGRGVFCPDGRLGVISDLLVDIETWRIRYFVVWLQAPGESGEVLLSPFWVTGPPEHSRVTVPMTTEAIVSGPNFAPEELQPLDEQILARYFGFLKE